MKILVRDSVSALAVMAVCAGVAGQANAADDITLQQAMQYFKYQDGNDRMRVELSPNWSDDLGFSMRGAIGGYLSDDLAIAAIVEYGERKREILGNLGFNLNGDLTIIGTVGNLREELVFDPATGREAVDQMEYGVSLKGHMPILFASEFELNGYLADADSDTDNAIAGKVYGFQYKSIINLSSATQIKLGAGYEWLEWDDNTGNKDRFTGSIEAYQHLNENFALFGSGFFNTTESRYGGGVDFNLSPGGYNTNKLRLEYKHIDGHRGVQDDDRVMATWSYGFGNGPTRYADAGTMSDSTGTVHAAADLAVPVANNRLLGEVMKRPTFLPERVIAKLSAGGGIQNSTDCPRIILRSTADNSPQTYSDVYYSTNATSGGFNLRVMFEWDFDKKPFQGEPKHFGYLLTFDAARASYWSLSNGSGSVQAEDMSGGGALGGPNYFSVAFAGGAFENTANDKILKFQHPELSCTYNVSYSADESG